MLPHEGLDDWMVKEGVGTLLMEADKLAVQLDSHCHWGTSIPLKVVDNPASHPSVQCNRSQVACTLSYA
jgi:hypothetical protein